MGKIPVQNENQGRHLVAAMSTAERELVEELRRATPAAAALAVSTAVDIQISNQLQIHDGAVVNDRRGKAECSFKHSALRLVGSG
jgi:hypothetical protein